MRKKSQPNASTFTFCLQYILSSFIMYTAKSANVNSNAIAKLYNILCTLFLCSSYSSNQLA